MALFSKLFGGDKDAQAENGPHQREFERVSANESTLTILSTGKTYPINDISLGGLSINGYDGTLHSNQYFQFKLVAAKNGSAKETEGMATVVRVKNDQLAAKFPPQPRLRTFLREFFD
jgi:hypothetical protein